MSEYDYGSVNGRILVVIIDKGRNLAGRLTEAVIFKEKVGYNDFVLLEDIRKHHRRAAGLGKNGNGIAFRSPFGQNRDSIDQFIPSIRPYDAAFFEKSVYDKRVYQGFGKADPTAELRFGPNITDWPKMYALEDNLLLKLACVLHDDVTTTDELIPSGETSSYRSNPLRLSEFALSRRDPQYVPRAKAVAKEEAARRAGKSDEVETVLAKVCADPAATAKHTQFGSCVFAKKPGDGSAREQAASCQKVLGGFANICYQFATKRYRSNCINWGILPFTIDPDRAFNYSVGDYVFVPGIRNAIQNGVETIPAKVITKDGVEDLTLYVKGLTEDEKTIILEGCLMNYYKAQMKD